MWYILFIQFLFLTINSLFAEQQFPLIDFSLNNVWIASNQLAIKDAMYGFFEPTLKPVALPPKLTINYQKDQPNPLLGQSPLIFKTINDNYHVIITESKPADLYLLDTRLTESGGNLYSAQNLQDATVQETSDLALSHTTNGIVNVDFGSTSTDEKTSTGYFFVAVKPHEGNFGTIGSGIAVIKLNNQPIKEKQKNKKGKEEEKIVGHKTSLTQCKTFPINNRSDSTNPISINGGLDSLDANVIDLFWSPQMNRLYVSLSAHTKANASIDQGACALLVGSIIDDVMQFQPVAPSSVFKGNEQIVATTGADEYVSIHKTRVLFTSTGLTYLLINGGNGKPEETKNLLYALPIVDEKAFDYADQKIRANPIHGLLANKKDMPEDRDYLLKFNRRSAGCTLKNAVDNNSQLYTKHDAAVTIGGGMPLPGKLLQFQPCNDCVFVLTKRTDQELSEILYSQAIFNNTGFIVAWTQWKRAAKSKDPIFGFSISFGHSTLKFLTKDNANNYHYHKTLWANPDNELMLSKAERELVQTDSVTTLLNAEFSKEQGGLAGLFNFNGIDAKLHENDKTNLLVALGNKKIGLLERSISSDSNLQLTVLKDSPLNEIGPFSCAQIIAVNNKKILAVGGSFGVALGIYDQEHFSWHKMACKHVKKILRAGTNVYVLTRDILYRMEIDNNSFVLTPIFSAKELNLGTFVDCGISRDHILLGTSSGLYFGDLVAEVINSTVSFDLKPVHLPNNNEPITKLFFVTRTGKNEDFTSKGQVYVLVGSAIKNFSMMYRLFVDDDFCEPLPDSYFKGKPSAFMHFANYRSLLASNGVVFLTAAERYGHEPFLQIECNAIAGYKFVPSQYLANVSFKFNSTITSLVQDTATGNWLIAGDFGVYSHPWIVT